MPNSEQIALLEERVRVMDNILSLHPDFMYLFGLDRRFIFVNKSLLDLWGLQLKDAVGKNFWDLQYPDALAKKLDDEIVRAIAGETVRSETEYTNHENKVGYYEYIFVPVRNQAGNIIAVSGTTRDITARKQNEIELNRLRELNEESLVRINGERERLVSLFDQAPLALGLVEGPEHRFSFNNTLYSELLFGGKELIGKTVAEAVPEAVEQGFVALLDGVYNTGIPFVGKDTPLELQQKDGSFKRFILDFVYQPLKNAQGKVDGIMAVVNDVTETAIARTVIQTSTDAITNERENFRNLFKQTPEMVCVLNGPEHTFEFVNEAHVKVLGFDATGRTVRDAQPESVEVHGILDNVYQTGVTAELREIPVTLGDRLRYFNLTYSARRNLQGQVDGVMILGTEITEQYLGRAVLKSQNQALQMTMAGASLESVLTVLAKATEAYIGQGALASVLLLDADEKHLRHGAAPSLPSTYNQVIDGLAIGPKVGSCGTAAYAGREVSVKDIANDPLWEGFQELAAQHGLKSCWSTPILSSENKLIGTFALYNRPPTLFSPYEQQVMNLILQTVALVIQRHIEAKEKQVAEMALRQSESRYRASQEQLGQAIEVARVGFYDWDIVSDKILFSPQMLKDWGISHPIEKLADVVQYIHIEDMPRVAQLMENTMLKNAPYHTEYRVRQPDGSYDWMDVRGEVHRNAEGTPIRFFGTAIVKTEQKNIENDLRQAQLEAEKASAAKGIFLANMSHEIRTPLGAIMGFLDLLKNPKNTREDLAEYIGVIDRNSKQLLRIVDDVLDLSKIEAGKFLIESIQFSLIELLSDFSSLMAFKAKEKGLTYELNLKTELPDLIEGDPTRIRQILSNVVGNAIKFTEKGHVHLNVSFQNGILNIAVDDTGCGIDPQTVGRLFQPFSQADNSTTRIYGGTGLGLSLTRRLSQALGGSFKLERSMLGQGSLFVVTLPLKTLNTTKMVSTSNLSHDFKTSEPKLSETNYFNGLKFLVVDDSPDNQALMKIVLQRWGAKVELASNGLEGSSRALGSSFDVVLMDVQMPIMDGHEATRLLRAKGFTKPIVALTAHAMKEEKLRCQESGFSNFLSKPIDKNSLLNLLLELTPTKDSIRPQLELV